jgi:hypothetical protein
MLAVARSQAPSEGCGMKWLGVPGQTVVMNITVKDQVCEAACYSCFAVSLRVPRWRGNSNHWHTWHLCTELHEHSSSLQWGVRGGAWIGTCSKSIVFYQVDTLLERSLP